LKPFEESSDMAKSLKSGNPSLGLGAQFGQVGLQLLELLFLASKPDLFRYKKETS
jgi:hypothetical protein